MFAAVPDLEDGIPLPANAAEALPDLTPVEELNMRARTIVLLAEMQGKTLSPDADGQDVAQKLARQMMEDPALRPDYSRYPNETLAYLAGLVAQNNCAIVEELSELKLYVVNKLVWEVEHAKDSKSRISALSKLGEVDGVDAFKKRTEMTVTHKSIEEVEKELFSVLEGIEYKVLDAKSPEAPVEAISGPKTQKTGDFEPEIDFEYEFRPKLSRISQDN